MTRGPMPELRDHLTSPVTRAALTVQGQVLACAREFLTAAGFMELQAPIIGPVTDPGGRGAKPADVDLYGSRYKLMTSAILYKQASLLMFDKIFFISPCVRLEPLETAATDRHLVEFHQIDVEMAGASRDEAVELAQNLLRHIVTRTASLRPDALETLGRDPGAFAGYGEGDFDRMTHADAVRTLHAIGHDSQQADSEIDWPGEAKLSAKAARPFFIVDYPKGSRGFYDRESETEPGVLRNFDLIAPEGYGELASGSERESGYRRVVARIRESGENPAKYQWYLDLLRTGVPASAGFGLGLERLTRYVAGLDAVWQASAYPKLPGTATP
ncbi:asparagine synthetase A [Nonomuraea sp. NPDC047529]|uniref:asparagine synthetase A n=1 Tax=Nonomuraea sp. NPDC047529 TaxID=3155623 RepID=UPI0033F9503C